MFLFRITNILVILLLIMLDIGNSACLAPDGSTVATATATPTSTPSASSTPVSVTGTRAVKIFFQAAVGGSFDAPADTNGTTASPGSGYQATRLFNPDNTLLANGSASWPPWLTSFEIGLSGTNNSGASAPSCARFANATESSVTNCNLGNPSLNNCGAPTGQFRVSEADCKGNGVGSGGPADPIYFRAIFNRNPNSNGLGLTENLLVTLEYAATSLLPAPPNPTSCLANGIFSPENCADFTWRAFLKHLPTDTPQSFFLLVPPVYSSVLVNPMPTATPAPSSTPTPYPGGAASTLVSRQFILPLATDPRFTVLQISRTGTQGGNAPLNSYLTTFCNAQTTTNANTPLCSGIVFYSLTIYRI